LPKAVCVILGGGQGQRLYPLTRERAKPAVPLAGKYRLIDVAVSNCLNSGFNNIFVLTQFNSVSLNRHIATSYHFDPFSQGFVQVLAAQQTSESMDWYQGTADAVRQNLSHLQLDETECVLVLSGDQLYRMNFQRMINAHLGYDADITVAATPIAAADAPRYGILATDEAGWITDFVEKPQDPAEIDRLRVPPDALLCAGVTAGGHRTHVASMAIYVFRPDVLREALRTAEYSDFGRDVIPAAIGQRRVLAHFHPGYWEDIGTIGSFFEANLALTDTVPQFNFFDEAAPIYTNRRHLPSSKINQCQMTQCVVADGCIIDNSVLGRCVVGLRTLIGAGCKISNCVLMGSDYYESQRSILEHRQQGIPAMGIGPNSVIDRAIIDKNARVGENVVLTNKAGVCEADGEFYSIRDGIIVVPRRAVVPAGTRL